MVDKTKFSSRLRELRTARGLTLAELGEQTNLSKQAISFYEQGKNIPGADKLVELADFFDVSIDYLVGRTDNPERC